MDLGVSSQQLDDDDRGFSFRSTERLDMRFDTTRGIPASEVIASYDEAALASLFRRHGEEPHARRIAHAIVTERSRGAIETPARLAEVISAATPRTPGRRRLHPATRVFQALRIEVNRELETLPTALESCLDLLKPDGRLCVISYHSLEDRIVKRFMARERQRLHLPARLPRVRLRPCAADRPRRSAATGPQR